MAANRWIGGAGAVAQVASATITAYDVNTTYKVTINNKVVSVPGQGGTTATTATALQAALAASTFPEFLEVTWTVSSSTITGTAVTAGKPFTATSSVTGGTGTFGAFSNTTASAGPNDWSTAANWLTGAVPANGDDVTLDLPAAIKWGLAQSGVTLNSLTLSPGFSAAGASQLGLLQVNVDAASYPEYRPIELNIGATTVTVNCDAQLVRLNLAAAASTVNVLKTGSSLETTPQLETLLVRGTNAGNVLNAYAGSVGSQVIGGQTGTQWATVHVDDQAAVRIGPNVTVTTVNVSNGSCELNSSATTVTMEGGTLTMKPPTSGQVAPTVGTLTADRGASINYLSSGTLTTLNLGTGSAITFSPDVSRTVTNANIYAGASISDPARTVTWPASPGIVFVRCGLRDVSVDIGANIKLFVTDF